MPETVDQLSLAERFAHLRTPHNGRFFEAVVRMLAPLASEPCVEMYFNFAISSNERGRYVASVLSRHARLEGANYLDIGCAYAGFLVAFAERGARVAGLEIAPHLIEVAQSNLADMGLAPEILCRDATKLEDIIEWSDRFDLITCNDVIEHVINPLALVENIALLLRTGGLAYFEIPNRYYPRFVLEDGHYLQFGITLLDYADAAEYMRLRRPGEIYDVRFYLQLDQYEALFARAGLTLELLDETFENTTLDAILNDLAQLNSEAEERLSGVPSPLAGKIRARLDAYLRESEASPRVTEEERRAFLGRYGASFWRVLGRKPAPVSNFAPPANRSWLRRALGN